MCFFLLVAHPHTHPSESQLSLLYTYYESIVVTSLVSCPFVLILPLDATEFYPSEFLLLLSLFLPVFPVAQLSPLLLSSFPSSLSIPASLLPSFISHRALLHSSLSLSLSRLIVGLSRHCLCNRASHMYFLFGHLI